LSFTVKGVIESHWKFGVNNSTFLNDALHQPQRFKKIFKNVQKKKCNMDIFLTMKCFAVLLIIEPCRAVDSLRAESHIKAKKYGQL